MVNTSAARQFAGVISLALVMSRAHWRLHELGPDKIDVPLGLLSIGLRTGYLLTPILLGLQM